MTTLRNLFSTLASSGDGGVVFHGARQGGDFRAIRGRGLYVTEYIDRAADYALPPCDPKEILELGACEDCRPYLAGVVVAFSIINPDAEISLPAPALFDEGYPERGIRPGAREGKDYVILGAWRWTEVLEALGELTSDERRRLEAIIREGRQAEVTAE